MKKTPVLLLALVLGCFARPGHAAIPVSVGLHIGPSGHATVDIGFFYDDLAPYGRWVERPQYGWVWAPRAVATTWRPYQNGHWAWTDEGWIWISDEPYGWATYHYGRWYFDPDYGWEWVPGEEYAPAWVSWQEGDDYIGWAPLPPSVAFRTGRLDVSLGPDAYVFVPARQFLAPRVSQYAVPRAERERIFRQTRNVTEYRIVNRRIVNQGISVDRIQHAVGRAVPRYQVADQDANQRHHGARIAQNRVSVFRPEVEKVKVAPPPDRPAARRSVVTGPQGRAAAPGKVRQQEPAERRQPEARRVEPPKAQVRSRKDRVQAIAPPPTQRKAEARQQQPPPPPAAQKQRPQPRQKQPQAQGEKKGRSEAKPEGKPPGKPPGNPQGKPKGKPPGKPPGNPEGKQKNEGHGALKTLAL